MTVSPIQLVDRPLPCTQSELRYGRIVSLLPVLPSALCPGWTRSLAALTSLIVMTACMTDEYIAVELWPVGGQTELQRLAERARSGEKQAQLELGSRYEAGEGVPIDLARARTLYAAAAARSGGTTYVYSPPVEKEGRGRVIAVSSGPVSEGLPDAQARLARPKVRARDR